MNFRLLAITLFLFVSSNLTLAQFKTVNGDVSYGFKSNDLGLGIGITYDLNEQFDVTATARYFLAGKDLNVSAINFNAEYPLGGEKLSTYALGGLNITHVSTDIAGIKSSANELGINLGIGSNYYYNDKFDLFGELKYIFGQDGQMLLSLGTKMKL